MPNEQLNQTCGSTRSFHGSLSCLRLVSLIVTIKDSPVLLGLMNY